MTKQQYIDRICLVDVTDREKQIRYFRRGFLRQVQWDPPAYIWNIEKFRFYTDEDVKEIYDDVTEKPPN